MSKFEEYEKLKSKAEKNSFRCGDYKEINYGLQFEISKSDKKGFIRIYESKKNGIKVDLSQIKHTTLKSELETILQESENTSIEKKSWGTETIQGGSLIGTDESGKGDYFGPLVVAAVVATTKEMEILKLLEVRDSKLMKDSEILELSEKIKAICDYEVITIDNMSYNEIYKTYQNLNRLLAYYHIEAIEAITKRHDCKEALCDQFGPERLLLNELEQHKLKIQLSQRPKAEENIVVAAASILARAEYVKQMDIMSKQYNCTLLKGGGGARINRLGKQLVARDGEAILTKVSKLHFSNTKKILNS